MSQNDVCSMVLTEEELLFALGSSFSVLRRLPGGSGCSHGANGGRAGYLGAHFRAPELIFVRQPETLQTIGEHFVLFDVPARDNPTSATDTRCWGLGFLASSGATTAD